MSSVLAERDSIDRELFVSVRDSNFEIVVVHRYSQANLCTVENFASRQQHASSFFVFKHLP